uniref:60S ribosomal protein L36 n=1 Tax=Euglena gracilis TaxID=3039 RepID=A0A7L5NWL4_EUGGR|nr:60S large subunit ribosomal protein eL36 [Euglena gracilis]6ZJ3_Lx Chain Lx, Ribosomal protein eL36 [Euglena gracilis]
MGKFGALPSAKLRRCSAVTPLPKPFRARDRIKKPKKKLRAVRDLVQEVVGFSPYERRMIELLKVGREKRALRFAKRRLGTHRQAKKKRDIMTEVLRKMRAAAHPKK